MPGTLLVTHRVAAHTQIVQAHTGVTRQANGRTCAGQSYLELLVLFWYYEAQSK